MHKKDAIIDYLRGLLNALIDKRDNLNYQINSFEDTLMILECKKPKNEDKFFSNEDIIECLHCLGKKRRFIESNCRSFRDFFRNSSKMDEKI